jgi:hypothetical protein
MIRYVFLFLLAVVIIPLLPAQNIAIGQWNDHLSYSEGVWVVEGNGKAFCLTTGGITVVDKSDNSVSSLSKLNGLSDVEPVVAGFNTYNNKLFIAYKNSNIDIVESNNAVVNMLDLKLKFIMGSKAIYDVYFMNQYAYVSSALGIMVIDMDKYEVKDTYVIGDGGSNLTVRAVTSDANYIYAATNNGVYRASVTSNNLANFAAWSKMNGLPNGVYNSIAKQGENVLVNYSKWITSNISNNDSVFILTNGVWTYTGISNLTINSLNTNNDKLVVSATASVNIYNAALTLQESNSSYLNTNALPQNALLDNSNILWIADGEKGLVSKSSIGFQQHNPGGPESNNVDELCLVEEYMYAAPGNNGKEFYANGIYSYSSGIWGHIQGNYSSIIKFDTINNINHVLINPYNTNQVYASSLNGLIELEQGSPSKLYNENNSTLKSAISSSDSILIAGLAINSNNDLWISNSKSANSLCIKRADGKWEFVSFSAALGSKPLLGTILIDKQKQKWVSLPNVGMMVYNDDGEAPTTSNTKMLSTDVGSGALPSKEVYCIMEDMDGRIWIGTQKGVAVFYAPANVFNGGNYDAEKIYVQQDGVTQTLLETETIQTLAIDGANRKWIGTMRSGVFLMSADGTTQVYHFTETNSPLLSNNVKSIAVNQKNGEVFFATDKGAVSFRSTATEGNKDYSGIYAFPNPVKPEYTGDIAIAGLMNNTTVKITDVSGGLVFETESLGGQAIWNGKTINGERVSSGVYTVFCTNEDGTQKAVTKILFIK